MEKVKYKWFYGTKAMLIMAEAMIMSDSSCLPEEDRLALKLLSESFKKTFKKNETIGLRHEDIEYLGTIKGKVKKCLPEVANRKLLDE